MKAEPDAIDQIMPSVMILSSIMTTDVVSIGMDETLQKALAVCAERRIRHLPVVDENGTIVGIVTDRDIRSHLSPRLGTISENSSDRDTLHRRVHTVMARNVVTGAPDMTLAVAAKKILTDRVGCLPVVDSLHRVVGIVTTSDFLLLLAASARDDKPRLH